jgi:hypothetical protein
LDRKLNKKAKSFFKIILPSILVEISALKVKKVPKNRYFDTLIKSQIELQIHNGFRGAKDFYTPSTGPLGDDAEKFSSKSMDLCRIGRGPKSIFSIF